MTRQLSVPPLAWGLLLLLGTIWGGSFPAIRIALDEVPFTTIVAIRVAGAALALWLVVLARGLALPRGWRPWTGIAGMAVLNNILPFTLIAWGQQHIPSGLASILNAATAIFGVLIAALIFADEKLSPRKAAGVALGVLGVATAVGLANLTSLDLRSLGQWAVIAAAFCYGLSSSWGRAFLNGVPPLVSAAGMLTVSALVMVPVAVAHDGWPAFDWSLRAAGALAYLALIASGIAYFLFYRVLAMAGAGNLSLVTLIAAPAAIVMGAVILDESLHPRAYAGFALIAAGLLVLDGRIVARFRRSAPAG